MKGQTRSFLDDLEAVDPDIEVESWAVISDDTLYRYELGRRWPCSNRDLVNFVMLNPSTADALQDDPTIRRCAAYAKAWGFGGLVVTNLFALRSVSPGALYGAADPIGPDNDAIIMRRAEACPVVVGAWGNHGRFNGRSAKVMAMLKPLGKLAYLSLNSTGEPGHPLYLKADLKPVPLAIRMPL